jgi:hypothetical protein
MSEKKNDPYKLKSRDYWLLVLLAIAAFFYDDSHEGIINYPNYLRYSLWPLMVTAIVVIRFKPLKAKYVEQQSAGNRRSYAVLMAVFIVVGSYYGSAVALVPFNYYNMHVAQQTTPVSFECNIDSASVGGHLDNVVLSNTIYFHLQDKQNIIHTQAETPAIATMHALHTYSQYKLELIAHKGLLGSYWLQQWNLQATVTMPKAVK